MSFQKRLHLLLVHGSLLILAGYELLSHVQTLRLYRTQLHCSLNMQHYVGISPHHELCRASQSIKACHVCLHIDVHYLRAISIMEKLKVNFAEWRHRKTVKSSLSLCTPHKTPVKKDRQNKPRLPSESKPWTDYF